MKTKKGQNSITKITRTIGYDKKTHLPIVAQFTVETTNTRLRIYRHDRMIGEAGVQRKEDFNFDVMLMIAFEESGSKIQVA